MLCAAAILLTLHWNGARSGAIRHARGAVRASDPNPARYADAGIDFPSVYFFRGIRQEADPAFTMLPSVMWGSRSTPATAVAKSGRHELRRLEQLYYRHLRHRTPDKKSHYEEDFYVDAEPGRRQRRHDHAVLHLVHEPEGSFGTVKSSRSRWRTPASARRTDWSPSSWAARLMAGRRWRGHVRRDRHRSQLAAGRQGRHSRHPREARLQLE